MEPDVAASAGLTGMLCCVAPMVLFMFGIMGGTYAISFADFFYQADGSPGAGAWGLRCAVSSVRQVFGSTESSRTSAPSIKASADQPDSPRGFSYGAWCWLFLKL